VPRVRRRRAVRFDAVHRGERLEAVARLRHDFDLGDTLKLVAQLVPCQLLVVHDDHLQGLFLKLAVGSCEFSHALMG